MDEIGLFPLGIVLLPAERIPLHVFEPRYRELVGECLDEGREFGLVLEDARGLREVGTRAAVVEVLERFPDGRLNVLVEGGERFRLVELTSGRSFRTGTVEPLVDEDASSDPDAVARTAASLRRVAALAGTQLGDAEPSSATPSFELAAHVGLDPAVKQALLESRSEPERLRRLERLLDEAAAALRVQAERAEAASRNGHLR